MPIKLKLVLVNVSLVLIVFFAVALVVSRWVEAQQLADSGARLAMVASNLATDLANKERVYREKAAQFSQNRDVVLYTQALVHFGRFFDPKLTKQTRSTLGKTLDTLRTGTDVDAVEVWARSTQRLAVVPVSSGKDSAVEHWVRKTGSDHQEVLYQVTPDGLVLAVTASINLNQGQFAYLQLRRFFGQSFVRDAARGSASQVALFSGKSYVVGTLKGIQPVGFSREQEKASIIERQTVGNEPYQVAFQRLPSTGQEPIILAVALSARPTIEQAAQTTRIIFGVALLALVCCSLLIYLWAGNVVRPIKALIEGAQRVHNGHLDTEIPIYTRDELGELAQRFNEMTRSLRTTQDELLRSEKLASVGKLSAGVAHEINNPLGTIINYLDLLLEDVDDPQIREFLMHMRAETRRIKLIVRELLDFSRQTPTVSGPVDLNAVVRESLGLVPVVNRTPSVKVVRDFQPGLPDVWGDSSKLKQVVVNIVINAVQAMPNGGTLSVLTRQISGFDEGRWVQLSITDTGTGIAEEHLQYVFDPFFTTKGVGEGTGLGLAVSYGIVKAHGGTIEIKSASGEGTEVLVSIPVIPFTGESEAAITEERL